MERAKRGHWLVKTSTSRSATANVDNPGRRGSTLTAPQTQCSLQTGRILSGGCPGNNAVRTYEKSKGQIAPIGCFLADHIKPIYPTVSNLCCENSFICLIEKDKLAPSEEFVNPACAAMTVGDGYLWDTTSHRTVGFRSRDLAISKLEASEVIDDGFLNTFQTHQ